MQRIGDIAARTWDRIQVTDSKPQETVTLEQPGAPPFTLTAEEAAAAGLRWLGSGATRRWQLGLCRDDRGEWVYPPERTAGETPEQMLERNREARRRMKERCVKRQIVTAPQGDGRRYGFED